jgi:uncharacterized FlaG/YvyC family protein
MKEYISKDYINNLLEYHLDNWWGQNIMRVVSFKTKLIVRQMPKL